VTSKYIFSLLLAVTLHLVIVPSALRADSVTLNPVDDGSLYTCNGCNPDPVRTYLLVAGYIVGEVDFSTAAFKGLVESAVFSVNPYGLPLFGPQLDVYGFASSSSTISEADLASPTLIGTWILPSSLGFGQDAFFDVTKFLQSVQTPYVDIILKNSGGTDVFSSTQYNYGHPSQLTVVTPEPAAGALVLLGLPFVYLLRRVPKTVAR
jgi:hypothetical protein